MLNSLLNVLLNILIFIAEGCKDAECDSTQLQQGAQQRAKEAYLGKWLNPHGGFTK